MTTHSIQDFAKHLLEHTSVTWDDIRGPSRLPAIVKVRHEIWWIIRGLYQMSYPRMAHLFNRDHTTIIYGVKKFGKGLTNGTE